MKSRKWLQTCKTSSSCGVNSNCVQFVWICGRNAHYERRKFYCLKRTTGHSMRTCFVFVVFPFLFCFVPLTTCLCWKLAAGKQTPEGERTRRPRQLKLPFWQVLRRQAGGQSKHIQIPQTNTGGKYEKTYKPRINRGSGVGRETERKEEGKKAVAVL